MQIIAYLTVACIFLAGLYGLVTSRHLVHLVICLSVMQSATYVLLLTIGFRTNARPPIFLDHDLLARAVDPVVQALTLTDVTVGAAVTALLLAMAVQVHKHRKSVDPEKLSPMKG